MWFVLVVGSFHAEFAVGDAVKELHIGIREVPREFPRGTGIGLRTEVFLVFRNGGENFLGGVYFAGEALEHHFPIALRELCRDA